MMNSKKEAGFSRRQFLNTAALGVSGISTGWIVSIAAAQAQTAAKRGAESTRKLCITVSPSGRGSNEPPGPRDFKQHVAGALEGFNAGASIVHLRGASRVEENPDVRHGQVPQLEDWKAITESVKARSNLVINYGSSAMEPTARRPLLELRPETGSFLAGHHFSGLVVLPGFQHQSALDHLAAGVMPEVEILHTGDLANLNVLIDSGLMRAPYCVTLFFEWGNYYGVPGTVEQLNTLVGMLRPNTHWTVCVKGPRHLEMAAHAIALGGHVRTGLENDLELSSGNRARTQGECVERIARLAKDIGREIATPQEAREMLGLPRKPETATSKITTG